jgi:hypothetical protein
MTCNAVLLYRSPFVKTDLSWNHKGFNQLTIIVFVNAAIFFFNMSKLILITLLKKLT